MGKAYSDDFRTCVIANYHQGKTTSEILSIFGIGSSTLKRWITKYRTMGHVLPQQRNTYRTRKFSDAVLIKYVKEHPSATLEEIAQHVSAKPQSVWSRLNLLGITRKKKHIYTKNATNNNEKYLRPSSPNTLTNRLSILMKADSMKI